MTPETLSELKSLLEKATPGIYKASTMVGPCSAEERATCTNIEYTITVDIENSGGIESILARYLQSRDDADLACFLKNAAPDLIKAVEQRDRYRTALKDIRDGVGIWIPTVAADKALKDTKEETNDT